MGRRFGLAPAIRHFYKQFYNRFAFTYDPVSRIVSRGEWRAWTQAAIPFVRRPRVLEIAFGTGNLLLDLTDSGYSPIGVDLSPFMIEITQAKFRKRGLAPSILRAAVQQLPFPTANFDSIVITFPPGFVTDPRAMHELRRVLKEDGRLISVDAPHLYPRGGWPRLLNWAYRLSGGSQQPGAIDALKRTYPRSHAEVPESAVREVLPRNGWSWQVHRIEGRAGYVHVMIGAKSVVEAA